MATTPRVHLAANQHYACILCGRCCRRFQVRLTEAEVARLQALDWGDEPDVPREIATRRHGQAFFRRRADGGCVFLDPAGGACRMHTRFGLARKALTCRGYPYNVASTWPGEVAVIARLDCPAVQQEIGPPLTANRRAIEALVAELGTRGGFTQAQLDGLERPAVELITATLTAMLHQNPGTAPGTLAYALILVLGRLRELGSTFLNDTPTLAEVMPTLRASALTTAARRPRRRLGPLARLLFRVWWATVCRRDEELVNPRLPQRLQRTAALAAYALGRGSLRTMGAEHPDFPLSRAGLFAARPGHEPSDPAAWRAYYQFLQAHLEAPQCFGVAYYGEPFFSGLQALLLSYPLALASARLHAAARAAVRIEAEDVRYAVGAVDHGFGRSPILQWRPWRLVETHFAGPRFPRLLHALGWE